MSNGCICCTLREDLLVEVSRLAQEKRFDYLLIESTGISEPLPVAETFTFEAPPPPSNDKQESAKINTSLSEISKLDTMVTVVDAQNFLQDFKEAESLQNRGESLGPQDRRSVTDLLIDQIEFCDVLILNKLDLIADQPEDEILVTEMLRKLNPRVHIVRSTMGQVPLHEILNTGRFSFQQAPGWLQEMRGQHTPETEEYGISSMVFRSDRPFHPERYWTFVQGKWMNGIIRSKGLFWLASRVDTGGTWSQAGGQFNISCAGSWMAAAFPPDSEGNVQLPSGLPEQLVELLDSKAYGDRRQELVYIGVRLDKEKMEQNLNSCILTDEEYALGPKVWSTWPDPFPAWIQDGPPPPDSAATTSSK